MTTNLLCKKWTDLDSSELKLLLDARIGGPGQFDGRDDKFYLPLARESCRISLTYVPVQAEDPILNLGKQPIRLDVEDASLNHDRYLYNP